MAKRDTMKVPPHSIEAEQSVLGGLLLDNSAWDCGADQLNSSDFYRQEHQTIFQAIQQLIAASKPADVVTVFDALQAQGKDAAIGGLTYLNDLAQSVPSAANMPRYAEIVVERSVLRKTLAALMEASQLVIEHEGDAATVLNQVTTLFSGIEARTAKKDPVDISAATMARLDHWEALFEGRLKPGISMGLPTLDSAIGGIKAGALITVGARSGVGKTAFASQIGLSVAQQGKAVLLLSQEMVVGELVDRLIANLGRVSLASMTSGRFANEDWDRISEAADQAKRLPFFLDDTPSLTLNAIRAKAKLVKRQHGLDLLIVDYAQLCAPTGTSDKRHHQIEQISRGLKALAKELGIAVLLLSQLNRASTQRDEPQLVDLKESGAIEEDADVVILLHPKGNLPDGSLLIAAIVAKNRQGRRCRVALSFNGSTQRWVESCADVSPSVGGRGKQP